MPGVCESRDSPTDANVADGKPDIAALVVRIAHETPTWGYMRIRGGLTPLGHDIARNTIKAILADHGIEPAPERVFGPNGTTGREAFPTRRPSVCRSSS
jgi:hypothetical protein